MLTASQRQVTIMIDNRMAIANEVLGTLFGSHSGGGPSNKYPPYSLGRFSAISQNVSSPFLATSMQGQ